ncbi:MAG: hypothetical protein KBD53_10125 [Candidatus Omnitrophica bacterium]|nr:hypothetical protein [Candidatus Omnitrophota bacterium]
MPTTLVASNQPSYRAYKILHIGYIVLPLFAGIDKFSHILINWNVYLSPIISPMNADFFMKVVGVIEIIVGIIVAAKPRYGAYLVAVWLWLIIINLLSIPGFYDIALRDFGLSLGALALGCLAKEYSTN